MPDTDGRRGGRGWWAALVLGLAALSVVGVLVAQPKVHAPEPVVETAPAPSPMFARLGKGIDDATLVGTDSRPVAWGALAGTPRALFFGFTHCPEICPTTIADLAAGLERAGPAAAQVRIDFVTFDPARDTPEALAAYLSGFGPQFRGFSGDAVEIERVARAFRAAYKRVDLEAGDYTIDHTTSTYLLNARGEVVDILPYQAGPAEVDAKLRRLLAQS